ncbi:MAG: PAS domain-containing protein, partial [Planctomycetales bacterium]|nr:PAS domain-containing protein [Planctomycetales bacterium]
VGGAILAFAWHSYQRSKPLDGQPLSSRDLESVLSAISDASFVFDGNGKYLEIFTANPQLVVRPVKALLGKRLHDFLDEDVADRLLSTIKTVIETGTPAEREDRIILDGQPRWFSARVVPIQLGGEQAVLWASREIPKPSKTESDENKLLRNLLRLQDRERKLISCELHDGMLQHLIVAHLMAQVVARDIRTPSQKLETNLATLQATLNDAIREGRTLIQDLRPFVVDEHGIEKALNGLIERENEREDFAATFQSSGNFQQMPKLLEGSIFRIVQEALNNIRRHSHAKSADVKLIQDNDIVELVIEDNGVGFDDKDVSTESFGLKSIRNRAELFGGHASIESTPGRGTQIRVRLHWGDGGVA